MSKSPLINCYINFSISYAPYLLLAPLKSPGSHTDHNMHPLPYIFYTLFTYSHHICIFFLDIYVHCLYVVWVFFVLYVSDNTRYLLTLTYSTFYRSTGFILEGFPHNPDEVQYMLQRQLFPDVVVIMTVDVSDVQKRLLPTYLENWRARRSRREAQLNLLRDLRKKNRVSQLYHQTLFLLSVGNYRLCEYMEQF